MLSHLIYVFTKVWTSVMQNKFSSHRKPLLNITSKCTLPFFITYCLKSYTNHAVAIYYTLHGTQPEPPTKSHNTKTV